MPKNKLPEVRLGFGPALGSRDEPDFLLDHTDHSSARCTVCKNPRTCNSACYPEVMTPSTTLPTKADNGWASSALAASPKSTF